ncbi:sensor domain-containing diguanylate cyclase [Aestuariirhabdus sp. Z084]|uniref:sensor domain-containing diguanylate cyclase n=1 Tax=Aestuariirhabdus haliotis TaxID=2918751 RepID=UPI00201B3703|nr:sensor domain-containing diguanylate cyclase [Aestuariirhabdus haliotis]MCL6415125.1 sensor domain-containing diguanylate cyclase [Aestuariirhabdus haliotis]MCL6419057.1 sensor domain-containing diguanylate cyclase [Aestuariirhabdus haliotis]
MESLRVDAGNKHTGRSLGLVWGVGSLMLVLVLYLAWGRYQVQGDKLMDDQLRGMEPMADFLAADTERVLYGTRQLFHAARVFLQQNPESPVYSDKVRHNLQQLLRGQDYLGALMVLDASGQVVHWNRPESPPELPRGPWTESSVVELGEPTRVGLPQRSPMNGEHWGFFISQRMLDEFGVFQGSMVAWVDLNRFAARYDRVILATGSRLALASENGTIYFQVPGANRRFGVRQQLPSDTLEQASFPRKFRLNLPATDEQLLVATSQIHGHPLWAAMAMSQDEAIRSWRDEKPWELLMLALLCVMFLAGMVQISLQLVAGDRRRLLLAHQASTDALTGAYNRRYLNVISRQLQRARVEDQRISLCVLDIDNFKEINDRYGHNIGDDALKQVAFTLQDVCRDSDQLIRFGGDEFVLILHQTSLQGAVTIAEKCREAIAQLLLEIGEGSIHLAGSFGVTQWLSGETLESALARADRALYEAKSEGRNRVEVLDAKLTSSVHARYQDE